MKPAASVGFLLEPTALSMRRADRLFQTVQLIRGRRLSTAEFLAARLEVSVRTVYRDVADLQRQGVPIEGEAGVGYRLGAGFELPPLMFSQGEADALVVAARPGPAHPMGRVAKPSRSRSAKAHGAVRMSIRTSRATPDGRLLLGFPTGCAALGPSAALPALARHVPCGARAPCSQPQGHATRSPPMG